MPFRIPGSVTEWRVRPLPTWLWLYGPLAVFVLLHALPVIAPGLYADWVIPEDGLVEWMTPLMLVMAAGFALSGARHAPRLWLVLFVLGCVYFAGEEVSWGQRVFGWTTPDSWETLNKQGETNIHNVSAVFDSKPRLLFSLAVLAGGVVYPLSRKSRGVFHRLLPPVLWPTIVCVPAAVLALTAGTPEMFFTIPESEPGEVKELFLAFFLLLYSITVVRRLKGSSALRRTGS